MAPGPVEGDHALGPQALPQGMLADKRRQLSDQLGVAAAGQVGFDALLDGGEAGLLEACRLGPGERHVRHFGERPTPPQGQGAPQGHRRDLVAAGGQLAPGVRQKRLEAGGVQVAGSHPQEVAGGPGHHDVVGPATPQRLPEPGDVHLQGGEGPVGRLALPEVVNEALGGHDLVGGEEEPSQQVCSRLPPMATAPPGPTTSTGPRIRNSNPVTPSWSPCRSRGSARSVGNPGCHDHRGPSLPADRPGLPR